MFDKHKGSKPTPAAEAVQEPSPHAVAVSPHTPSPAGKAAVIGPGIEIDGSIGGSENLLVEGQVRGSIELSSYEVTIGKSGKVKADITGRLIRVSGQVAGDLTADEKVVISSTGNVRGNVKSPRVVLEDGAVFKGSIDMDPGESTPIVKSVDARPEATGKPASVPNASAKGGKTPDLALKSH